MKANFSLMNPLFLTKGRPICPDLNRLLRILLMVCAKMDKEIPPEHIIRSSGNNYKQNKNKNRIFLKGLS